MIVKNEKVNDKRTAIINRELNCIDCSKASFKLRKLAPANAGIDNKKEILLESILLKFKNLAAVIVIPALLTPGIRANIWNRPIIKIDLKFRSVAIFLSVFLWSAKKSINPKNKVVDAITFVFLKRWINSVVYKIYPNDIRGKEPIIIKLNNFLLFFRLKRSFLK